MNPTKIRGVVVLSVLMATVQTGRAEIPKKYALCNAYVDTKIAAIQKADSSKKTAKAIEALREEYKRVYQHFASQEKPEIRNELIGSEQIVASFTSSSAKEVCPEFRASIDDNCKTNCGPHKTAVPAKVKCPTYCSIREKFEAIDLKNPDPYDKYYKQAYDAAFPIGKALCETGNYTGAVPYTPDSEKMAPQGEYYEMYMMAYQKGFNDGENSCPKKDRQTSSENTSSSTRLGKTKKLDEQAIGSSSSQGQKNGAKTSGGLSGTGNPYESPHKPGEK